jgi:hypothetical protein
MSVFAEPKNGGDNKMFVKGAPEGKFKYFLIFGIILST